MYQTNSMDTSIHDDLWYDRFGVWCQVAPTAPRSFQSAQITSVALTIPADSTQNW